MTDAYENGKSLKICDLFAIIPISRSIEKIEGLVDFSKEHNVDEKALFSALQIAVRAIMLQHIQELDTAGNVGIEGSEAYFRSSSHEKHPNRPRIELLDRFAHCAYELLKPIWSAKSIDELKTEYDNAKKYFDVLESFLADNVFLQIDDKQMKMDPTFLSIAAGQFFADSVLNPRYSYVLSNYGGSFVRAGRKEYLERNWKGYLVVVCFFYQQILEKYYGPTYIDDILKAKDIDELWSIGEAFWKDALTNLNKQVGSEEWLLKTKSKINLDRLIHFVENECPSNSAWTAKKIDEFLGFHQLRLLDGRTKFFGGPVFFIRLLLGEIEVKKMQKESKPVEVIKLIHPILEDGGNRFSYGLLTWSTPPGWIIFTWCGNDYSGGSIRAAAEIEQYIKKFDSYINYRTYTISQKELEDFALSKTSMPKGPLRNLSDEEGHRVLFHEARDLVERISAMKMELLVAAIFSNFGGLVNWSLENPILDDYEIDITVRAKDVCYIIECSHRMSSEISFAENLISEFNAKGQRLVKIEGYDYNEFKRLYVTREKFFLDPRMKSVISKLKKNHIDVTSIEDLIQQANLSDRQKEKIKEILKEMDCWRPGYSDFTTDSDVQDVLTCLDTRNLPFLGTLNLPNDMEIPDKIMDEK